MCAALHHPHQWPASCAVWPQSGSSLSLTGPSDRNTGHLSTYLAPTNSHADKGSVTHHSHFQNINVSNLECVDIIIRHYQIIIAISPVCSLPTPVTPVHDPDSVWQGVNIVAALSETYKSISKSSDIFCNQSGSSSINWFIIFLFHLFNSRPSLESGKIQTLWTINNTTAVARQSVSMSKLLVQIVSMSVIKAEQLSLCTALNRILLHFTTNYLLPRTLQMLTSQSLLAGTDWSSGWWCNTFGFWQNQVHVHR